MIIGDTLEFKEGQICIKYNNQMDTLVSMPYCRIKDGKITIDTVIVIGKWSECKPHKKVVRWLIEQLMKIK